MHVYRWDLDKTYLATDIHSVRGLLRSALETAEAKRNVPGADALLRALLAHDPRTRATILSGSPTQLRDVLTRKLELDGIRFDALELKDNLGNLRRGRLRAVRGQLGYKLPRLLAQRVGEPTGTTESLFGDDAEVDALVYALYADAVAGRADADTVRSLLRAGGAYDDQVEHALAALRQLEPHDAVDDIWILVDRRLPLATFAALGPKVRVVFSWLQAALGLWARGRIGPGAVIDVARRVEAEAGLSGPRRVALAQDAVRRGILAPDDATTFAREAPGAEVLFPGLDAALARLGPLRPVAPPSSRDYQAFLDASRSFPGVHVDTPSV